MPKYSSSTIILGIDPGLADTGFAILDKSGAHLKPLAYGSIKTLAKQPLEMRLKEIYLQIERLIKKWHPEKIAVEKLFFCKNLKTATVVGQARGVVLLAAGNNNLELFEYTPLQVKQALTSYGKASKGQIQQMVKIVLNLKQIPQPDDAADALAIAICCANSQ